MWFCVGVAVIAAALADPLVEFASNAGAFGPCSCTDHSNADVIPTLIAGLLLAARFLYLRVRQYYAGEVRRRPDWLRPMRDALGAAVLRRLLPAILALQLCVLFAIETTEQLVVRGHLLGGTIWLGAPAPISLAIHALFCIAVTLLAARALRTLTATAVRIVDLILRTIALTARSTSGSFAEFRRPLRFRRLVPVRCRIGERAPPRRSV
jgi:hypothetical protein